jgi:putative transposase
LAYSAAEKATSYLFDQSNQVWSAATTYIPINQGKMYLEAVIDWHNHKVLSFRLSNTLGTVFCVEALNKALGRFGRPQILNTDQGAQFTGNEFTSTLKTSSIAISMDGRGRCQDNIFIDRV